MDDRTIFKRYELKFLADREQLEAVRSAIDANMTPDVYSFSEVRNVYCDTPDFILARRSIENPAYKEKLRIRCYGHPEQDGKVFVELKKKYEAVVYKRRLSLPLEKADDWLCGNGQLPTTQIGAEIDYLKVRYPGIGPAMVLSYDREAFRQVSGPEFRVTVDSNILARTDDIDLAAPLSGCSVLPDGYTLIEVKTIGGIPLWMTKVLTAQHIYKNPFSKYGNAYKQIVLGKMPETYAGLVRNDVGASS
jgi:hypothetical protein